MKKSFINILREPDSVLFQYSDSGIRFEEPDGREEQLSKIDYISDGKSAKIILYPCGKGIKRVKLRWRGDMSDVLMMLGDDYERIEKTDANWTGIASRALMPWYFQAYDGEKLNCFGVKTSPAAFCLFQCDSFGITLWLDVRSGGAGVWLREPLVAAEVVCREGRIGEAPYDAAVAFCRQMCEKPNLPKDKIFGVNNWYWAYGNITHDSIMTETDYFKEMCADAVCDPYMIIDDGWQLTRYDVGKLYYNGGPWDKTHSGFSSMAETAAAIKEKGAKPGIWFRPLKTNLQIPAEALSKSGFTSSGLSLDPSHPFVLDMVERDVKMIRSWGYELIKHDFTTDDAIAGKMPQGDHGRALYDSGITNCQALARLYALIQKAADGANIIGCNTMNHLAAGVHQAQRVGGDTSGRSFEITRNNGVHTFVRLPQNNTFFAHDPDCAAFTARVSADMNLDFMKACAVSGAVTLASVTPGILKPDEMTKIREIYKIASMGGLNAKPADWLGNNEPSRFVCPDGKEFIFDWYRIYDGVRTFYTWTN